MITDKIQFDNITLNDHYAPFGCNLELEANMDETEYYKVTKFSINCYFGDIIKYDKNNKVIWDMGKNTLFRKRKRFSVCDFTSMCLGWESVLSTIVIVEGFIPAMKLDDWHIKEKGNLPLMFWNEEIDKK